MMSWCTRSGTARCQMQRPRGEGAEPVAHQLVGRPGGGEVQRLIRRRFRRRSGGGVLVRGLAGADDGDDLEIVDQARGQEAAEPAPARMSAATSSPPAAATSASASGSVRPRAAATRPPAGRAAPRAQPAAVPRSDGRRGLGQDFLDGRGHGGRAPCDLLVIAVDHALLRLLRGILQILLHLVLVRQLVDALGRVLGGLVGPDDVGPDEEEQLGALDLVRACAEQVAEDRDLVEEAELGRLAVFLVCCRPPSTIIWPSFTLMKRRGLAVADDRLRVAVDGDAADDVVHRLVDLELDAAVVADQGGHLERRCRCPGR